MIQADSADVDAQSMAVALAAHFTSNNLARLLGTAGHAEAVGPTLCIDLNLNVQHFSQPF